MMMDAVDIEFEFVTRAIPYPGVCGDVCGDRK